MWPNFRSPLLWDVFAVGTYATVSLLFWYMGMIPDLATLRDRATTALRAQVIYGFFALGWRGSNRHWHRYETAYLLLAGAGDAAGALRALGRELRLRHLAAARLAHDDLPALLRRRRHLQRLRDGADAADPGPPVLRAEGHHHAAPPREHDQDHPGDRARWSGYAYATEFFIAWYSGNPYERFTFLNRAFGPYAWAYWMMVTCNVIVPQLFWFKQAAHATSR